jgi:hypothetical protein
MPEQTQPTRMVVQFSESELRRVSNDHIHRRTRVLIRRAAGPGPDWNPAIRTVAQTNPDVIATMRVRWVRFDGTAPEASASQSQRKPPFPALPLRGRRA